MPQCDQFIEHLLTDSRKLVFPKTSLFFALATVRKNGCVFVDELYHKGVKNFVVPSEFHTGNYPDANFIFDDHPVNSLQQLAAYHRGSFSYPVIGITGSNGKTVVKEWLYQLLHTDYNIVRSPKSYNSQIGVPLSVWQMSDHNNIAIFEAGISLPNEMDQLQKIISPNIGILTNIGEAHSAGFADKKQKATEKFRLFSNASVVVCNADNALVESIANDSGVPLFSWGKRSCTLQVIKIDKSASNTTICAEHQNNPVEITIPFTDDASVENAISCWCVLLYLQVDNKTISERMLRLTSVEMRLQLKKGINNCLIINDSYSNDLSSLNIALDFLQQQSGNQSTTVILSDIAEAADDKNELYKKVAESILHHGVKKFIGIGPQLKKHQHTFRNLFKNECHFLNATHDFKNHFSLTHFKEEVILLKGARAFAFEEIDLLFAQKIHQTVLEVNLTAMVHNLKEYQRFIKPSTKIMAMVKAFSYGSGSAEVANVLQYHHIDYLAVAYADEGVELRKAGIHTPILVLNPEEVTFGLLVEYNLEPELYSFSILQSFAAYLGLQAINQFPVHIKMDTGMHRLGFEMNVVGELMNFLAKNKCLVVKSIFTHLAASDDPQHDAFTFQQAARLNDAYNSICSILDYPVLKHISNSSAIFRHPELQYDMVRLGIGLYGIDNIGETKLLLQKVAALKSTVAQLRKVAALETIGYNRKGVVNEDSLIATVRIGYADGFSRKLGNGVGNMSIKGKFAPVIGNVCMDMTMLDVTGIDVKEGDEVEIFGLNLPVQQLANWCNTIPYEILTGISQRVKRVYYNE